MLISNMESKSCKAQIFLLFYEPHCADTLYCLLVERSFSMELKQKVLKVILVLTQLSLYYRGTKGTCMSYLWQNCRFQYYRPEGR
jgi:hypothetical protein